MDQGHVAQSKIRYRSLLLRHTFEIAEKKRSGNHNFKNDSQRGHYGLREGQLPHVADAIQLFNDSWNQTTNATALKCWIKSKSLPAMLESETVSTVQSLTEACINLVQDSNGTDDVDLSLPSAIDFEDVRVLEEIIAVLTYVNHGEETATSPEHDFVQQVISRCSTGNLHNLLKTPDSLDHGRLQNSTPEYEIIKLLEEAGESSANSVESIVPESTVSTLEQLLSSALENSSNQSLRNALIAAIYIAKQV